MIVDEKLFLVLNSLSYIPGLDIFLKLIVNEYFVPVLLSLSLLFLWISPFKRNKEGVLLAASSVGLVDLLIKIVNLNYFRARPFTKLATHLIYYKPTDSSFPANSAAVAFAIAAAIYYIDRRMGKWAFAVALVFSLSRVIVGVHYPSDVIAGAVLGLAATYFLSRFRPLLAASTKLVLKILETLGLEPLY